MAVTDGDLIKVVAEITMPNLVVGANVFYYQLDDPTPDAPSNAQIVTAVDLHLTNFVNQIDQEISDEYEYTDFEVDRVSWDGTKWETQEDVGSGSLNIVGGRVVDGVPHGCAMVLTANTARPQTRGRKFLPGLYDDGVVGSVIESAVLTAMAAAGSAWLTTQGVTGAAELVPVVLGQSGPSAGLVYPLLVGIANAIIGYQRRRKPGVGS